MEINLQNILGTTPVWPNWRNIINQNFQEIKEKLEAYDPEIVVNWNELDHNVGMIKNIAWYRDFWIILRGDLDQIGRMGFAKKVGDYTTDSESGFNLNFYTDWVHEDKLILKQFSETSYIDNLDILFYDPHLKKFIIHPDVKIKYQVWQYNGGNQSTTYTFNWDNWEHQRITLTWNITLETSNILPWNTYLLQVIQDATGGRTINYSWNWVNWVKQDWAEIQPSSGPNDVSYLAFTVDLNWNLYLSVSEKYVNV